MIYLGFLAIFLMNISAIPQLIKIIRTHNVRDLTIGRELLLLIGCLFYLVYGIWRGDIVIIASNTFATIMFSSLILLIRKYK